MRSAQLFILFVAAAMAGCTPLKQCRVTGGQEYDHFAYMDDLHCGLLQIGPSNVLKTIKIIDAESYAIAPGGTRYGIVTKPHDYDLKSDDDLPVMNYLRVAYVRDRVYLVDTKGRRVGRSWTNGPWQFHFVMDTPHGRDTREFDMQIETFYYNPALHGAPN